MAWPEKTRLRSVLLGSVAGVLVQTLPAWSGQPASDALPTGGTVTAGQASISQSGARMDVTQSSQNAIINWQRFNIGNHAEVDFQQPSSTAMALNRVLSADPSTILGRLTANGQIVLVNPNGVVFGSGAKVDVGGMIASVLDIKDADFLAGKLAFQRGSADGRIVNQGRLTAADGGYIALLAPEVRNDGVIQARLGTVALAAGDAVTLDLSGSGRITLKVDPATVKTLIDNRGMIVTTDGQALLSSRAVNKLLGGTINTDGVIEANSLTSKGGDVVLDGSGSVTVAGTLDVSGPNGGGNVSVTGNDVRLASKGQIDATSTAEGNGGAVTLFATGTTTVAGSIDARGGPKGGDGGWVETSGNNLIVRNSASVDTSAPSGTTGTWLLNAAELTVAAKGGNISGTALSTALAKNNIALLSSNGDISANQGITWSTGNFLQLSSFRNVNVSAPINNSDSAPVTLRADNTGTGTGTVNFANGGKISTAGAVSIFYNPVSFTAPTDFSGDVAGGASLTAFMLVNTLAQLQAINTNLAGDYALGRNIDARSTAGMNGGAGFVPLGSAATPFTGIFDGQHHTITDLTINRPTENDVGLFGVASTIRDVGLVGGSVTGNNAVGGLVGEIPMSFTPRTVTDSFTTGAVSGAVDVGGLVGANFGTVTGSHATGAVSGVSSVGGLVGFGGIISDSYATGTVTGLGKAADIGGLQGANLVGPLLNFTSAVTDSFATGAVQAGAGSTAVGGLVGNNAAPITNSHATGAVTVGDGSSRVGGLVGDNSVNAAMEVGAISNSFATGAVTGGAGVTDVGGLVGLNGGGPGNTGAGNVIGRSFATGAVTAGDGAVSIGGLVGESDGTVTSSRATGAVTTGANSQDVGGLAGANAGLIHIGTTLVFGGAIADSFATGDVRVGSNSSDIGGLVGFQYQGSSTNSYATGAVSAGPDSTAMGGLVGNNTGTIVNSYSTGRVTAGAGSTLVGGLLGENTGTVTSSYWNVDTSGQSSSAAGTGLTSAQMMEQASFVGWDFTNVWTLPPGSFPKLRGVGGQ